MASSLDRDLMLPARLEDCNHGIEILMLKDDPTEAKTPSELIELDELNTKRQSPTGHNLSRSGSRRPKEADKDEKVLVLHDADWSHGINGIVASKIVEKICQTQHLFCRTRGRHLPRVQPGALGLLASGWPSTVSRGPARNQVGGIRWPLELPLDQ